jgi:hypothetical protein
MLPLTATGTGDSLSGSSAKRRTGPLAQLDFSPGRVVVEHPDTLPIGTPVRYLDANLRSADVTTPEADSMAELIADCADIPAGLRPAAEQVPPQRTAAAWSVDDACLSQVQQLDEYI